MKSTITPQLTVDCVLIDKQDKSILLVKENIPHFKIALLYQEALLI